MMVRRHSSFSLGSLLLALLLPNSIINNNNGVGLLLGANAQGGNGTASIPDDFDDTDDTLASAVYERATSAEDPDSISIFRDALEAVDLLDTVLGNASGTYTVFAPTNAAVNASAEFVLYLTNLTALPRPMWKQNLVGLLLQHIVPDMALNASEIFDNQKTELSSMRDLIAINQFALAVQTAELTEEKDVQASNGVLHIISKVLRPKFLDESFADLELQTELGPDDLGRTALTDVVDFVDGRNELKIIRQEGLTFVGCRIRAFNRLEEYLPQTVNEAPEGVILGEFLNASYTTETTRNLIQYSLIPKNYYREDMENGFAELTVPLPGCGHMWVTKMDDKLCFNNGCVVDEPEPREYLASNGIGYVVDKCQVCPGVAMLTDVASEFTIYNLRDMAQFLRASEWNMRDLRLSVGNGSDVTMFASINTGWSVFSTEDTTRLSGDEWKPHQLDLLGHSIVQGRLTKEDLQARYDKEGAFNLTSLINQTILVDFDPLSDSITVDGGDLFFPNIQGVDGLVHFTDALPLPRSVTKTIYDIANEDPKYTTQISYIDTVMLDSDMKRLLPLTAMYAPNKEWEGKKTEMNEIAEKVLKNHMFEKLYRCDELRSMVDMPILSVNGKMWTVSVNKNDFPCFESADDAAPKKACIIKCDILARNGIVHELDTLLLFEAAETRPPSEFGGSFPSDSATGTGGGSPESTPTVFQRPTPKAPAAAPKSNESSSATATNTVSSFSVVLAAGLALVANAAILV